MQKKTTFHNAVSSHYFISLATFTCAGIKVHFDRPYDELQSIAFNKLEQIEKWFYGKIEIANETKFYAKIN